MDTSEGPTPGICSVEAFSAVPFWASVPAAAAGASAVGTGIAAEAAVSIALWTCMQEFWSVTGLRHVDGERCPAGLYAAEEGP